MISRIFRPRSPAYRDRSRNSPHRRYSPIPSAPDLPPAMVKAQKARRQPPANNDPVYAFPHEILTFVCFDVTRDRLPLPCTNRSERFTVSFSGSCFSGQHEIQSLGIDLVFEAVDASLEGLERIVRKHGDFALKNNGAVSTRYRQNGPSRRSLLLSRPRHP